MMVWIAWCTVLFQYIGDVPVFCLTISKSHPHLFSREGLGMDKSQASASSSHLSKLVLRRMLSSSICDMRATTLRLLSSKGPSGVKEKQPRRMASQVTTLDCWAAEARSSAKGKREIAHDPSRGPRPCVSKRQQGLARFQPPFHLVAEASLDPESRRASTSLHYDGFARQPRRYPAQASPIPSTR